MSDVDVVKRGEKEDSVVETVENGKSNAHDPKQIDMK